MANFNKVILAGNLTRDPELRYTPKGTAIVRLGLAINRRWTSETGEQREEVTFVDVDAFAKQAETIAQYMRKGSPMLIEGRLRLDTWDDKQTGQKRSKLGVVLDTFQFLGSGQSRPGGPEGSAPAPARPSPSTRPAAAAAAGSAEPPHGDEAPAAPDEDDVPF